MAAHVDWFLGETVLGAVCFHVWKKSEILLKNGRTFDAGCNDLRPSRSHISGISEEEIPTEAESGPGAGEPIGWGECHGCSDADMARTDSLS